MQAVDRIPAMAGIAGGVVLVLLLKSQRNRPNSITRLPTSSSIDTNLEDLSQFYP